MKVSNLLFTSLIISAGISLSACAQNNTQNSSESEVKPNTLAQLQEMISDKSCQQDNQCRVVAIGQNPCGGPESYEAYSTLNSDEQKVRELAKNYTEQRKQENTAEKKIGMCRHLVKPAVACKAQVCQFSKQGSQF